MQLVDARQVLQGAAPVLVERIVHDQAPSVRTRLENPVGLTPVVKSLKTFEPMFAGDKVNPNTKKQTRNEICAQLRAAIVFDENLVSTRCLHSSGQISPTSRIARVISSRVFTVKPV